MSAPCSNAARKKAHQKFLERMFWLSHRNRDIEITLYRWSGNTYASIANQYGMSLERVRQIVMRMERKTRWMKWRKKG